MKCMYDTYCTACVCFYSFMLLSSGEQLTLDLAHYHVCGIGMSKHITGDQALCSNTKFIVC